MADARGLGPRAARRESSSLSFRTSLTYCTLAATKSSRIRRAWHTLCAMLPFTNLVQGRINAMAQMQPIGGGKVEPMSNVVYDLATVLSNCGEAVDALDQYIDDAKSANDQDALKLFEQLRD